MDAEGPRPTVFQDLHDRLTSRYPCICTLDDADVDDGAWSDGPLINNFLHRAAVLGIAWSKVDEVLPFIIEEATSMGLVVLDENSGRQYRPA